MSEQTPDIAEDMIERGLDAMLGPLEQGAGEPGSPFRDQTLRYRRAEREEGAKRLRVILEAALAGRVVLDLPEPEMHGSQPFWPTPMGGYVSAASATTVLVTEGYYPVEWVERDCAARMAAAREARRLAAEGGDPETHWAMDPRHPLDASRAEEHQGPAAQCQSPRCQAPISTLTGEPCLHPHDYRCIKCVGDGQVSIPAPGVIALEGGDPDAD